jgi:hypothetical protein
MEDKMDFTGQLQVREVVGSGWMESWSASARRARRRRQQLGEGGVADKQQLRSGDHHLHLRAFPLPFLQCGELLPPDAAAAERHRRPDQPRTNFDAKNKTFYDTCFVFFYIDHMQCRFLPKLYEHIKIIEMYM